MRCKKCGERTEVLETIQRADTTRRRRRCLNPACQSRFTTTEVASSDVRKLAEGELVAELKRIHRPTKGYDPEALAAAIATDRRRDEIKRKQKAQARREEYEGEDDTPAWLSVEDARKVTRGY